jgi:hypothetical protein
MGGIDREVLVIVFACLGVGAIVAIDYIEMFIRRKK